MDKIIELKDIYYRYGDEKIFSGINLTVNTGDFLAISGPNGGGKTTLLRIMLKLLKPSSGKVIYFNRQLQNKYLKIGYLPQKSSIDLHFPITVNEVVLSGLLSGIKFPADAHSKRDEISSLLGLSELLKKPIGSLSGGQLQRTLLARALISEPNVIMLDEPLSYVDKHFEQRIYDIIRSIAYNTTIILVSHEMSEISPMANRHIIVNRGIETCHAIDHNKCGNIR